MGAFVLGILVGWLAEWLFYTFWVKAGEDSGDCSSLKSELELKNRQISSLQAQLAADAKSTVSKASSTSTTSAKKTASKSKATSSSTKATPRKTSTAKKAPAAKAKITGDDFTKLTGIGPSMSAKLKSLGIDTFNKLAATDDDILRDMLEESGARLNNNKEAMDTWNEQATIAATGDFAALKKMQAELKK